MAEEAPGFAVVPPDRRSSSSRRPAGAGGRRSADRLVESRATVGAASAGQVRIDSSLPPENELWDVRATARFLRMSMSWVYKRVEDGTLPVARLNGYALRFEPAALRAWASNHVAKGSLAAKSKR